MTESFWRFAISCDLCKRVVQFRVRYDEVCLYNSGGYKNAYDCTFYEKIMPILVRDFHWSTCVEKSFNHLLICSMCSKLLDESPLIEVGNAQ